jgi:predicted dithiol-disulfide oxidoreductase (DUF899 family)
VAPVQYNYWNLDELGPAWQGWTGEMHGLSAFLRRGDRVFHTYSSYARGTDMVNSTYRWFVETGALICTFLLPPAQMLSLGDGLTRP